MEEGLREVHLALRNAMPGISRVNAKGKYVAVNEAYASFLGYEPDELIGGPWEPTVHADSRDAALAAYETMLDEGKGEFEALAVRKDGSTFYKHVLMVKRVDERGDFIGHHCFMRDITARKNAELDLKTLATIVEYSDDAIVSIDLEQGITAWNAGAEALLGFRREEVLGKPIGVLWPEGKETQGKWILEQIAAGHPVRDFVTERLHKDGRRILVSLTVSPIRDDDGRIVAVSSILRDVTERVRAQEELRRTAADLARSNADLERFAYVASHDLQEPLRLLMGYLKLLDKRYGDKLEPDGNEFLRYAVDGAVRMRNQIKDLLSYSRVGFNEPKLKRVDCAEAVERALLNLKLMVDENKARVTWDELPEVEADEAQLVLLFQNLLGNALKFRSEEPPEVHVGARNGGGKWVITVTDNGIGVDPRYSERVFGVFERLHTLDDYPGTGIGLAICKRIVERHGGRIGIEPTEGPGSTFFFTLPAEQARG